MMLGVAVEEELTAAIHEWVVFSNEPSARKVKRSVTRLLGKKGLSHQNVIRITEKTVEEFNLWKRRDLSGLRIIYLILDGIRLEGQAGTREKEAVLVACR
jgi:transposase-like protein